MESKNKNGMKALVGGRALEQGAYSRTFRSAAIQK